MRLPALRLPLLMLTACWAVLVFSGCALTPNPSPHLADAPALGREHDAVDLAWIDEAHPRPWPQVAVVVLPSVSSPEEKGYAHLYARLLEAELKPYFERTQAVRPEDDRLNNPPDDYFVLVIETHLPELNRGSYWLRWLVGFGVGTSRVQADSRAHYIGERERVAFWSDRGGSWQPAPSEVLVQRDLRRRAQRTARFVTSELLDPAARPRPEKEDAAGETAAPED